MKKTFLAINIALITAVCIGNYFFITVGGRDIKAATSFGFVLIGIANLIYAVLKKSGKVKFAAAMAGGFVLAMLGDILINSNFIIGAGLFALGHVAFAAAYCLLQKLKKLDIIVGGMLFAATGSFVAFFPLLAFEEETLRFVCIAYALIISMMVGKAAGNFIREKDITNMLLLSGAVLFAVSDFMLVLAWFADAGRWSDIICMATYYPAQCLLAHAVYHYINKENNK
ncbi:MAG: lysoplasmalogenase [Oscillospiraceae bacterium]|nr:lysoplasmalogenase [Oscillospiraceae bacterium]